MDINNHFDIQENLTFASNSNEIPNDSFVFRMVTLFSSRVYL